MLRPMTVPSRMLRVENCVVFLSNMIEGKLVHCLQVGEGTVCDGRSKPKSRDRIVAQCFLAKLDIALEMTKSGTACDWPKFSGGHYKVSDKTCVRNWSPENNTLVEWLCSSSSRKMLAEPRICPASMKVACMPAATSMA